MFLVRESQRNPKGFVLSLCHLQKVKHYLILPVSAAAGGGGGEVGEGFGGTPTRPELHLPGRARRRDGSTSPWTTGRPASPTSSSSWSSTRSTAASCPASCGTTAPAWRSEPGTAGTPRHGTAQHPMALLAQLGTARLGTPWHRRHGSAPYGTAGALAQPARHSRHTRAQLGAVSRGVRGLPQHPLHPGAPTLMHFLPPSRCRAPPSPRDPWPQTPHHEAQRAQGVCSLPPHTGAGFGSRGGSHHVPHHVPTRPVEL